MFSTYLARWDLTPDGDPIVTHSSRLLPVRRRGVPAMLKLPMEAEEKRGSLLMPWWDGQGAARVLAHDRDALLLERAMGAGSLTAFARTGRDDEATGILCAAIATLHKHEAKPPPNLVPLTPWFKDLWPAVEKHGGILVLAAATARELLAHPQDVVVLHGDIHHDNVLDFGARGWLAIDPKGLIGERGFDYANLFCNPETDIDHRAGSVQAAPRHRDGGVGDNAGASPPMVPGLGGTVRRLVAERRGAAGDRLQDRRVGGGRTRLVPTAFDRYVSGLM